jgi:hypothetical protein
MRGWRLAVFAFSFWCLGAGMGQMYLIAKGEWTDVLNGKQFKIIERK